MVYRVLALGLAACSTHVPAGPLQAVDASALDARASEASAGDAPVDPFAGTSPLPASLKGYELYAWEEAGRLRFMLITGTNREKTLEELRVEDQWSVDDGWVAISGSGIERLEALLARVPDKSSVAMPERRELGTLSLAARDRIVSALR